MIATDFSMASLLTLRRVFDAMPQPVWFAHPDGRMAFVNSRGLALLGASAEEIEGTDAFADPRCSGGTPLQSNGATVAWIGTVEPETGVGPMIDANLVPIVLWTADRQGEMDFHNEWFASYSGLTAEQTRRGRWHEIFHPDDRAQVLQRFRNALETGTPYRQEARIRRADGAYRWHYGEVHPLRDASGAIVKWIGSSIDVNDRRRAAERQAFLLRASDAFGALLEPSDVFQAIADLSVPLMGDTALFFRPTRERTLAIEAVAGVDPQRLQLVRESDAHDRWSEGDLPYDALERNEAVLISRFDDEVLNRIARSPERKRVLQQLNLQSTMLVPLVVQEQRVGLLSVSSVDSGRALDEEDLQTMRLLMERAAVALQNAQRYEREHRVAQALQTASLPTSLPQRAGARFYGFYDAAQSEAQIGGDWYDAFELPDGRIVLSIGDVAGHGLGAAVAMGNMRQIVRGIAQVDPDPALMLDAADKALRTEHADLYITAFAAVADTSAGTLSYASAGHPPPMLRDAAGNVRLLHNGGLPLGLRAQDEPRATQCAIRPGETLVLYTDGLTESSRDALAGERQLVALLEIGDVLEAENPAQVLHSAMIVNTHRDDVAILVVRFDADP
jgi:PAS domain S-box-containing protein